MRNILVAGRKAEEYFKKSVEIARQIGAIGVLGEASLGLGLLYRTKGKTEEAGKYFSEAIEAFWKCGADGYLKQARDEFASMSSASSLNGAARRREGRDARRMHS